MSWLGWLLALFIAYAFLSDLFRSKRCYPHGVFGRCRRCEEEAAARIKAEWGPWMISQLQSQKRIQPLPAFGYAGVVVKAKRKELLALLRKGLRSNRLAFPARNGAVEWPEIQLIKKSD